MGIEPDKAFNAHKKKQEKKEGTCVAMPMKSQRTIEWSKGNLQKWIPRNSVRGTTGCITLPPCNQWGRDMNFKQDCKGVGSQYGKVQQILTCSVIPGLKIIVTMTLEWTQRIPKGPVVLA